MNNKIDSLTRDLELYLDSGELNLFREKFSIVEKYFRDYSIFTSELNFTEAQLPVHLRIQIITYQFEVSFFQGNFSRALEHCLELSRKINRVNDDEFYYKVWKKFNNLTKDIKNKSLDFQLLRTFIYLQYALGASIKYSLVISGSKAVKAFLNLCILHKSYDEFGILLNKVILRMNDDSLKRIFNNTFPHLMKKRFKDSHWESIQSKEAVLNEDQDITIIQGM